MAILQRIESKLFRVGLQQSGFIAWICMVLFRLSLVLELLLQKSKPPLQNPLEREDFKKFFPELSEKISKTVEEPSRLEVKKLLQFFYYGYLHYLATGHTPKPAFLSMRALFCHSDGKICQEMQEFFVSHYSPHNFPPSAGILEIPSGESIPEIVNALKTQGYYIFKQKLPEVICEKLHAFAMETECNPQSSPNQRTKYNPLAPISVKYSLSYEDMLRNAEIRRLLSDVFLLSITQSFLLRPPCVLGPVMWWSTPYSKEPDAVAAQLYHFDFDSLNFLKFFVYLTDVGPDNGPHCFVQGSMVNKPKSLRVDRRLQDEEIEKHYDKKDIVEIDGSRGTMFLADTRAFHKGKNLQSGDRLIFQIVYADSLFGAEPHQTVVDSRLNSKLPSMIKQYPAIYSSFTLI